MINEETFASRLTSLREQKKVSAREMSLDLGQNGSYINRIENRKAFPSMQCFFYICDYLQISPAAFFDDTTRAPHEYSCAVTPQVRQTGNRLSGLAGTAYASLLT